MILNEFHNCTNSEVKSCGVISNAPYGVNFAVKNPLTIFIY